MDNAEKKILIEIEKLELEKKRLEDDNSRSTERYQQEQEKFNREKYQFEQKLQDDESGKTFYKEMGPLIISVILAFASIVTSVYSIYINNKAQEANKIFMDESTQDKKQTSLTVLLKDMEATPSDAIFSFYLREKIIIAGYDVVPILIDYYITLPNNDIQEQRKTDVRDILYSIGANKPISGKRTITDTGYDRWQQYLISQKQKIGRDDSKTIALIEIMKVRNDVEYNGKYKFKVEEDIKKYVEGKYQEEYISIL